jgi:hypothetical protein
MEIKANSGTSIKSPRPSRQESTTNHGISKIQEEPETCKSGVLTQDGGNYSDMKEDSSLTCGITES